MNLSIASNHVVRATDFARLLDRHPQAKLLSLDCFDTVLWRKVADPKQVFQELQDEPLFREYGITAGIRVKAERQARKARQRQDGKTEVTIEQIYAHALPDTPPDLIERLIEVELQVEERHLFAFRPAVELIRQARKRGLPVVMANDKYPRSRNARFNLLSTVIEPNASIGAGATILPGLRIGRGATIGAGSVVTRDVSPGETVMGNPARTHIGKHADVSAQMPK